MRLGGMAHGLGVTEEQRVFTPREGDTGWFLHLEKVILAVLHHQMVGGVHTRQSPILPRWERQVTYRYMFAY